MEKFNLLKRVEYNGNELRLYVSKDCYSFYDDCKYKYDEIRHNANNNIIIKNEKIIIKGPVALSAGVIPFITTRSSVKYLILSLRSPHDYSSPLNLQFPAGHSSYGETAVETAFREFGEEIALWNMKKKKLITFGLKTQKKYIESIWEERGFSDIKFYPVDSKNTKINFMEFDGLLEYKMIKDRQVIDKGRVLAGYHKNKNSMELFFPVMVKVGSLQDIVPLYYEYGREVAFLYPYNLVDSIDPLYFSYSGKIVRTLLQLQKNKYKKPTFILLDVE